jgi:hypothetical protein
VRRTVDGSLLLREETTHTERYVHAVPKRYVAVIPDRYAADVPTSYPADIR